MSQATSEVEPFHGLDSQRRRVAEAAADWLVHLTPHEMVRVLTNLDPEVVVLLGQRAERELGRDHLRRWR